MELILKPHNNVEKWASHSQFLPFSRARSLTCNCGIQVPTFSVNDCKAEHLTRLLGIFLQLFQNLTVLFVFTAVLQNTFATMALLTSRVENPTCFRFRSEVICKGFISFPFITQFEHFRKVILEARHCFAFSCCSKQLFNRNVSVLQNAIE